MSLIDYSNVERLLENLNNAKDAYEKLDIVMHSTILTINTDHEICIKAYYRNRVLESTKLRFDTNKPKLNLLPGYTNKEEISRLIMHWEIDIEG